MTVTCIMTLCYIDARKRPYGLVQLNKSPSALAAELSRSGSCQSPFYITGNIFSHWLAADIYNAFLSIKQDADSVDFKGKNIPYLCFWQQNC